MSHVKSRPFQKLMPLRGIKQWRNKYQLHDFTHETHTGVFTEHCWMLTLQWAIIQASTYTLLGTLTFQIKLYGLKKGEDCLSVQKN